MPRRSRARSYFVTGPQRGFRDLSEEVVRGALDDAGGCAIGEVFFANCGMHAFGQANIRGQVALGQLVADGVLPRHAPIANVEGGCATGSLAFRAAVRAVRSGDADCALAVGVEKTIVPEDPMKTLALFLGGVDQLHKDEWEPLVTGAAAEMDYPLRLRPDRILFLDTYAIQALHHMRKYGTTREQLAAVASKNHYHGSLNDKAQYRFEVSVEQALADKPVAGPLTRSMCCPVSDGAAAVIVASDEGLKAIPGANRRRAVRVRACTVAGGYPRDLSEESLTVTAARRAYEQAGVGPEDVDVIELHDSTAWCEIAATEALGLCEPGAGGALAESGATRLGGRIPINCSGGLLSKGHPLAATGLGMIDELVEQLRGEADGRQTDEPRLALAQNAGGLVGLDEALSAITILERV